MGRIIAIAIPKGGVGKTTTAVNLAACLAAAEKKTLLIDMDPAGSCSATLGIGANEFKGGIYDLFIYEKSIQQTIHKTNLNYLHFIPCNVSSFKQEDRLTGITNNPNLFKNIIEEVTSSYDYIIIDCPPYLKGMTNLAMAASDSIIIPIKSAGYSIDALKKIFHHMIWIRNYFNNSLQIEGILLTMYESKTKVSAITEKKVNLNFGKYVFRTIIPKSTAIAESTFFGKPVILFNARSTGSVAYLRLAQEIIIKNQICPVVALLKLSAIEKLGDSIPESYDLSQNVPDPFSNSTDIKFALSEKGRTKLRVMNLFGEEIVLLLDEKLNAGSYKLNWQPKNLSSGVYKYKIESGNFVDIKKMIYVKR